MEHESTTPETPSMSLSDLVLLLNLVRVTAERGAIKAEEMAAVGNVYEKLGKFLQASGALNPPAAPVTSAEADPVAQ